MTERDEIRDSILDEASRLFERYGYKKTTMDDLAREVGIGKGTLYLHFTSKEEIALSVVRRINARFLKALRAEMNSPGDVDERLRRMIASRVMFRFDNAPNAGESFEELLGPLRRKILEIREENQEDEAPIFAEILIEGRSKGVFIEGEVMTAARAILWATNSLIPFPLSPRELGERSQVEAKTKGIIDLLLRGLLTEGFS